MAKAQPQKTKSGNQAFKNAQKSSKTTNPSGSNKKKKKGY